MGDRTIEASGNMIFEDLTNNVKAVLIFNTYKRSGYWTVTESGKKDAFYGIIYKTAKPINPQISFKQHFVKGAKDIKDLNNIKADVGEKLADVEGSWLRSINIDGREYWNIDEIKPDRPRPMMDEKMLILPSDSRYRDD